MLLFRKKKETPFVSAVVAAAGNATRMEGIDKQQAPLNELPVVVRCIEALSACPMISEIVLVCPAALIPDYYAIVQEFGLALVSSVVGGGSTRQDSVFAGIEATNPDARYFAIHDGARPLIDPVLVEECIRAAMLHGAAALGVPPKDTIKRVDDKGFVTVTLPRENLVSIQTPQVFEAALYREAMAKAKASGSAYTDDCQLIEQMGHRVYVVPGGYENIKITTPEDLCVAGAMLRFREEGPSACELLE